MAGNQLAPWTGCAPLARPFSTLVRAALAFGLCACQAAQTPAPASPTPAPTLSPAPTSPPRSATLSELVKQVDTRRDAAARWDQATEGQSLSAGGGVKTGDEARARLDISDGMIVRMAAASEFTLLELPPEPAGAATRLTLAAGKLWAALTGAAGGGALEIETPAGIATVRGSYMSVEFTAGTSQVIVTCLEGACQLSGTAGPAVDLTSDQQAEVAGPGQAASPPQPMDAAQYADWAKYFPEAPAPTLTSILLSPGERQCEPASLPAGVVELAGGVGQWLTAEEAAAAIGDSYPLITLNGEPVAVQQRIGPERFPVPDPAWSFTARAYVLLEPGEYTVTFQWYWDDVFTCLITATGP